MALPSGVVIGTEGRGHVHHARAILGGDEALADDHLMRPLGGIRHPVERTTIPHADEVAPH